MVATQCVTHSGALFSLLAEATVLALCIGAILGGMHSLHWVHNSEPRNDG